MLQQPRETNDQSGVHFCYASTAPLCATPGVRLSCIDTPFHGSQTRVILRQALPYLGIGQDKNQIHVTQLHGSLKRAEMNTSQALPLRTHQVEETDRKAAGDREQSRRVEGWFSTGEGGELRALACTVVATRIT